MLGKIFNREAKEGKRGTFSKKIGQDFLDIQYNVLFILRRNMVILH